MNRYINLSDTHTFLLLPYDVNNNNNNNNNKNWDITGDNFNSFFFASYMMYPKVTPMTQGPKREYVVMYNSSCTFCPLPSLKDTKKF
jgi:hypothetical protein